MSEVSNFSSVMVDKATKKGSSLSSYHILVSYIDPIWESIEYTHELDKYLPDFEIELYNKPTNQRVFCDARDGKIRLTQFIYYAIKKAFNDYPSSNYGVIKSDMGYYESDNKSVRPDSHYSGYHGKEQEQRMMIGLYRKDLDIDDFKTYFYDHMPDIAKKYLTLFNYKIVKSNPRKPKVECTDLVYDQFGVLIEKGDLIAYPKGGDHNYYYVRKDEVVENTPKFVKLKNGDMTKADKVIVIKAANPDKKVSF